MYLVNCITLFASCPHNTGAALVGYQNFFKFIFCCFLFIWDVRTGLNFAHRMVAACCIALTSTGTTRTITPVGARLSNKGKYKTLWVNLKHFCWPTETHNVSVKCNNIYSRQWSVWCISLEDFTSFLHGWLTLSNVPIRIWKFSLHHCLRTCASLCSVTTQKWQQWSHNQLNVIAILN